MASGCTSSSSPILSNCANPTVDKCIKYTGAPVPLLGICTGDYLNEIEDIILKNIVNFASGVGIMISDIDFTTCSLFTQYITCCNADGDVPKSLHDLIKIIFEVLCGLDSRITTLEDFINDLKTGPYSVGCLSGLPTSPTFKQIIQAMLLELCSLATSLASLQAQITALTTGLPDTIGIFLLSHINSCQGLSAINKTGTGSTANLQFSGVPPIGTVVPFFGDLGLFDGSGVGRTGYGACGWALADGRGGRPNWQGVTAMGATVAGAPTNPSAQGATYSVGSSMTGQTVVTLSPAQVPSLPISGGINDPGHDHVIFTKIRNTTAAQGGSNNYADFTGPLGDNTGASNPFATPVGGSGHGIPTTFISKSTTGITLSGASAAGGGGSHENRMPFFVATWIIRIS